MNHYVVGDKRASQVLECLSHIVAVYGQHVIVLQYLLHVKDLVRFCCFFHISWYLLGVLVMICIISAAGGCILVNIFNVVCAFLSLR